MFRVSGGFTRFQGEQARSRDLEEAPNLRPVCNPYIPCIVPIYLSRA